MEQGLLQKEEPLNPTAVGNRLGPNHNLDQVLVWRTKIFFPLNLGRLPKNQETPLWSTDVRSWEFYSNYASRWNAGTALLSDFMQVRKLHLHCQQDQINNP